MDVREKLEVIAHLGDHITYKEDVGVCYDSALAKVIEDAYMELKNGVTVQEWISVKDRLPDETKDEYVLVVCDYHGKIKVETRKMWHIESTVTHWMPLPQPPKGE